MKQVWKFPLGNGMRHEFHMPLLAKPLCVQIQAGTACVWAEVDPKQRNKMRVQVEAVAPEGDDASDGEGAAPTAKKLKRVEDSDDEDALFGEETATQPQPGANKEVDDLFNSDEE